MPQHVMAAGLQILSRMPSCSRQDKLTAMIVSAGYAAEAAQGTFDKRKSLHTSLALSQ